MRWRERARRSSCPGNSEALRDAGACATTLAQAPAGRPLRVKLVDGDAHHAQRLRELGMFEGRTVQVLAPGNPLICKIGDCRFGLCQRLARCILVEPVEGLVAKSA
ncbi:MAG: ferrous iron transport protein A [Planctomycetes bacterium]|nr:ferrous iron transport protein A [Planctomycetota bacterium]